MTSLLGLVPGNIKLPAHKFLKCGMLQILEVWTEFKQVNIYSLMTSYTFEINLNTLTNRQSNNNYH